MDKKRVYREKVIFDDFGEHRHHHHNEEHDRPHRHDEEQFHKRIHVHRPSFRGPKKVITKLIDSKEELIRYVNELGEQGHHVDVYKIEDGLYKVVVIELEKPHFDEEEVEVEVDID